MLLIGERPGLATAESLSAYLAYRPRPGHTDAQRNLISNIHGRGVSHAEAARRILALAEQMMRRQTSGVGVKEEHCRACNARSAVSRPDARHVHCPACPIPTNKPSTASATPRNCSGG